MKRVLITGAGRGLGFALVQSALDAGHQVFATVRKRAKDDALSELERQFTERLHVIHFDAADTEGIKRLVAEVEVRADGLDILINNAGMNSKSHDSGGFEANFQIGELQPKAIQHILEVNAVAPILIAQGLLKLLKKGDQPKIVNISSWLGSISEKKDGGNYSYCASKAALNMLTRCLAFDLLPHGIVAIAVNPGWMQTDMGGSRAALHPDESAKAILELSAKVGVKDAGKFLDWSGEVHAW